MKISEKVKNDTFDGTKITSWYYYDETVKGLNVRGDLRQEETDLTGYKHYVIYFCRISGEVNGCIEIEHENAIMKSVQITKKGDLYYVRMIIAGKEEHTISFECEDVSCNLKRYWGVSYKNVYETREYKDFFERVRYVVEDKYLVEQKVYELSEGYSLEVNRYADVEQKEAQYSVTKAVLDKCVLKHNQEVVYEYEAIGNRVKPFTDFIKHRNGHIYYPFHIDLYGISYLEMDTLAVYNYVPQGYDNDYGSVCGESFIITDIHYDEATNLIAYGGCYWAATSDVMVGDFSNPLNFNPKLVSIHEMIDPEYEEIDDVDFVQWEEGKLIVRCDYEKEQEVLIEDIIKNMK